MTQAHSIRTARPVAASAHGRGTTESPVVKWALIALAVLLLCLFLVMPLAVVFYESFRAGWGEYWQSLHDPSGRTWQSIKLTLLTAAIAVPLNTVFGIAAAWCITKFSFRGKAVLITLIDLPFAISPVVVGLTLWLLFGAQGWFGNALFSDYELSIPLLGKYIFRPQVIFAVPGIVLATVFITFPFVARELIPLMQAQGTDAEQAARSLGASGWQTFRRITLPNIKWGLLYGVILCNARAMGEFGAVYVVSDRSAGQRTLPLLIERLFYESVISLVPVFAVASLLALLGLLTLAVKSLAEWRFHAEMKAVGART